MYQLGAGLRAEGVAFHTQRYLAGGSKGDLQMIMGWRPTAILGRCACRAAAGRAGGTRRRPSRGDRV